MPQIYKTVYNLILDIISSILKYFFEIDLNQAAFNIKLLLCNMSILYVD